MERIGVIIVAGGGGSRMGGARPKQFMLLGGSPVLAHTINNFAAALPGAPIVVVLPAAHTDFWRNLAARFTVAPHTIAEGGAERFHSVRNGLAALPADVELIAVQDGVRPLGSCELIRRTAAAAAESGAAIPVVEPVDSFRLLDGPASPDRISDSGTMQFEASASADRTCERDTDFPADARFPAAPILPIDTTTPSPTNNASGAAAAEGSHHIPSSQVIDRRLLRIVQTPQVFRAELLRRAYEMEYRPEFTDDASVAELAGATITLCPGERANLKITTPEDLLLAEALLAERKNDSTDEEHL